ncbi:hypothetical protein MTO96_025427 [Rhipicephalus appendiculatus]
MNRPYKCAYCPKAFFEKNVFAAHVRRHTGDKPYLCQLCCMAFTYPGSVRVKTEESFLRVKVEECYVWPEELAAPPAARELPASSGHCASIATQPRTLVADASSTDKCPHCDKGFAEAWRLRKHIRIHTNERPHKCAYCPKAFFERNALTLHERRHTGDKPYLCQRCCMAFTYPCSVRVKTEECLVQVKIEIEECSDWPEEPAGSPTASVSPASSGQFAWIANEPDILVPDASGVDVDDRPHKCELCGKSFLYPGQLRRHMRSHTKEKPYTCPYCPELFSKRNRLAAHVRRHTGDKPYLCQLCCMAFTYPSSGDVKVEECSSWPEVLADPPNAEQARHGHPKGVVNEPPVVVPKTRIVDKTSAYKCSHCEKHFADQWNLDRHMRIHSGERPFKCDFCPMDFNLKTTLTAHLRTHTGNKPYKCHLCDMAFSWRSSLTYVLEMRESKNVPCGPKYRLTHLLRMYRWLLVGVPRV